MTKALSYTFLFAAVQVLLGIVMQLVLQTWYPETPMTAPVPMLITTAASLLIVLAAFLGFKFCPVSRNYVRTKPWSVLFWSIILAVGIIIPLSMLEEMIPKEWRTDNNGEMLTQMLRINSDLSFFQPGYIVICMLAPLVEEVVFRGAIIRSLIGWLERKKMKVTTDGTAKNDRAIDVRSASIGSQWIAIIVSALFFAAIHMNPAQMPHALIVGTILGWLYTRTGSIVPCFLIHWINNSVAFVLINAFPMIPADSDVSVYLGGNGTNVIKALIFSLMIALPALYQLTTRTKLMHNA